MSRKFYKKRSSGFTLIELLVTIVIVAVLVALAGPSFSGLIERWRVRQGFEGLQSTLYYARAEAIKRGGNVSLRKEPTGTNGCALASGDSDWDCGWYIFSDINGDGDFNGGDARLQGFLTSNRVQVTRSDSTASITFDRWGMPDAPLGFTIIPQGKSLSDSAALGLCMNRAGRISKVPATGVPCP